MVRLVACTMTEFFVVIRVVIVVTILVVDRKLVKKLRTDGIAVVNKILGARRQRLLAEETDFSDEEKVNEFTELVQLAPG